MDLAVHPDGSVYLATRNEILRLRDTKGTARPTRRQRIVFLDTKGDYPHNGLSGLCFDSKGDLYFGMGENLGAAYKLIGADGTTITGEGEGGNIFHCTADGKKLRRVATGFWNPFGICRDIYGRLFAVDNDPDQCRRAGCCTSSKGATTASSSATAARASIRSSRGTASCPARCR